MEPVSVSKRTGRSQLTFRFQDISITTTKEMMKSDDLVDEKLPRPEDDLPWTPSLSESGPES